MQFSQMIKCTWTKCSMIFPNANGPKCNSGIYWWRLHHEDWAILSFFGIKWIHQHPLDTSVNCLPFIMACKVTSKALDTETSPTLTKSDAKLIVDILWSKKSNMALLFLQMPHQRILLQPLWQSKSTKRAEWSWSALCYTFAASQHIKGAWWAEKHEWRAWIRIFKFQWNMNVLSIPNFSLL